MKKSSILKISHRGFIKDQPENSMSAFNEAIKEGFDMIEMDIQLTHDNEIVIYHDRHINGLPVETYNYEQMKLFNPHIILLNYFFNNFPNYKNIKIYLDLKGKEELSFTLKNFIHDNNINTSNLYIASFNISQIRNLKGIGAKLGYITCSKYTIPQYCDIIRKLDFISVDKGIIDNDVVNICKGLKKKLFVFTCNNNFDKHYLSLFDIDGIISDIKL